MTVEKGKYGYISNQKYRRSLKTLCFFILPIAIFLVGFVLNHGNRNNIYTIIALVGCIPACISAVGMITMLMRKPMRKELYREISELTGKATMAYELYVTTRKVSIFLDAVLFNGSAIVAYTDSEVSQTRLNEMQDHIKKGMQIEKITCSVKIFDKKNKNMFLDRLRACSVPNSKHYENERKMRSILLVLSL